MNIFHGIKKITFVMKNYLTLWKKLLLSFVFSSYALVLYAQQPVTGRVSAGDSALPGVIVYIKGSSVNTQTDNNGQFSINAPKGASLTFNLMGYLSKEIPVNNRSNINVELEPTTQGLGEVVVVGYGTQKRKDLTGAISSLNASAYKDQPVLNASSALQGRVAGVSVANSSGAPGGAVKIRIRGANSINASNDPLYVIDGVALSSIGIQDINVNDIASMYCIHGGIERCLCHRYLWITGRQWRYHYHHKERQVGRYASGVQWLHEQQ
jgi:TonB-dependent starch-binding outer membrane protein SusC